MSNTFVPNPTPQPSGPPSEDHLAHQMAAQILLRAKQNFSELVRMQREGIRSLWTPPLGTPQAILGKLGTKAAKLFAAHAILTKACQDIAALDNTSEGPADSGVAFPPLPFVVNPDGSVTVVEP